MIKECPYKLVSTVEVCGGVCEIGEDCKHNCSWSYETKDKDEKLQTFNRYLAIEWRDEML